MCLVVAVSVEVQVPCWEVHQQLVFGCTFCGCSSSIYVCRKVLSSPRISYFRYVAVKTRDRDFFEDHSK